MAVPISAMTTCWRSLRDDVRMVWALCRFNWTARRLERTDACPVDELFERLRAWESRQSDRRVIPFSREGRRHVVTAR